MFPPCSFWNSSFVSPLLLLPLSFGPLVVGEISLMVMRTFPCTLCSSHNCYSTIITKREFAPENIKQHSVHVLCKAQCILNIFMHLCFYYWCYGARFRMFYLNSGEDFLALLQKLYVSFTSMCSAKQRFLSKWHLAIYNSNSHPLT